MTLQMFGTSLVSLPVISVISNLALLYSLTLKMFGALLVSLPVISVISNLALLYSLTLKMFGALLVSLPCSLYVISNLALLYSMTLQMFGALLVSLPVISVISNLTCENFDVFRDNPRNYYLNLLTVCIVHFCNFNQVCTYL
jgi:hypothetical protein